MKDSRRCTAKLSDRSRKCRNAAILGGSVCHKHGGAAPQVRRSAWERLAALVDPALDGIGAALESDDPRHVLPAARLVLDRAGYGPISPGEMNRITEEQGKLVADVIRGVLNDLGVMDRPEVPGIVHRHLALVGGGE